MADDGRVTRLVRHLDGIERFGQRADLVNLDQNRVAALLVDALLEELDVGDEQIVADKLAALADLFGQQFPASPVGFAHAVFDAVDRVFGDQFGQIVGLLFRFACNAELLGAAFFGLELSVIVDAVLEEFRRGAVERQRDLAALALATRLVARLFDRLDNGFERVFRAVQNGGEAAFVADRGAQAAFLKNGFEIMENLGAHPQPFAEVGGPDRSNHEFLKGDRCIRMRAAIDDVHHWHGQRLGVGATNVAIERLAEVLGGGFGAGHRHGQDRVGAQVGLGRRAVQLDHEPVNLDLIRNLHADQLGADLLVDVCDCRQNALAEIALGVAVAQFDSFVLAG